MTNARRQKLAAETGTGVYWLDAVGSAAQIANVSEAFGKLGAMLE